MRRKQKREPLSTESPLAGAIKEFASDFQVIDCDFKKHESDKTLLNLDLDASARILFLKQISGADILNEVLHQIKASHITLLIIPRQHGVRFSEEEFTAERQLLAKAPCETLQLRPGKKIAEQVGSVLVATSGSKHASPALQFGAELADGQRKVTALYVEEGALAVRRRDGRKTVEKAVRKSLKQNAGCVTPRAVVANDISYGVSAYANAEGHDMIVLGAGGHASSDPSHTSSMSEKLIADMDEPTIAVVRDAIGPTGRFLRMIETWKASLIPQLDREGRVELVERLESSSKWDFDFVFLICLATLIAALGLSVDSPPVVIGAMLVAPLMTPMLGLGLSVVQSNQFLAIKCLRTIRRGFLLAFLMGCLVGCLRIVFASGVTDQMASRGAPSPLDLVVAFVSGIVAAYAFGRPHLLSVLPGIAIATSLVPPVATAGLALCSFQWSLAVGAMLLFLSNFIAIVLGSASSLWFVGVRGPREFSPLTTWTRRWMFRLLAVAGCLALFFTISTSRSSAPDETFAKDSQQQELETGQLAQGKSQGPSDRVTANKPVIEAGASGVDEPVEELHVVLQHRATRLGNPPMADLTLIIPSHPQPVHLKGIVVQQTQREQANDDMPRLHRWAGVLRRLTTRDQPLALSELYRMLQEHASRRITNDAAPM